MAEVAVPRDVDRTFDYLVPARLRAQIDVGVRVRVPFRQETLIGYVTALKTESDYPGQLSSIAELIDPEPVLAEPNLKLARWMRAYYLAPLGTILQAMVPLQLRKRPPRTRPYARLRLDLDRALEAIEELKPTAPQQSALLEALLAWGSDPEQRALLTEVGCSTSPLNALKEKGYIEIEQRPVAPRIPTPFQESVREFSLTAEQHEALESIRAGIKRGKGRYLLHGVNASGKTELYLQSVQHALELGKQAIVIVPEISLTPQLIARLRARFGENVAIYHSGLTEAQRTREWERITGGEAHVAVGVRAAVFAPFDRLGLIVVDEEHESTYKQDDPQPRYHARTVALKRAELTGATVVLGSATPSVESTYRAQRGGLQLLRLRERAVGGAPPQTRIIDLGGEDDILSPELRRAIVHRLKNREQVLLLLNLRGFSRCVICRDCRETQKCPRCGIALVYHAQGQRLVCHYCGHTYPVHRCRSCTSQDLAFIGAGTEQAEHLLCETFPGATLARLDSDAVRRGQHGDILEAFRRRDVDILLGTQMVGLGLDFPHVTLAGVLSADTLLDLPDFRAGERTFQLVSQAVGRAGRGERPGEVFIQTNHPDHYAVAHAARGNYEAFYAEELRYRRDLNYPPFSHLIKLTCEDRRGERARGDAAQLAETLSQTRLKGLEVLGPFKALPYRRRGVCRWQLLLKTKDVRTTTAAIRDILPGSRLRGRVKPDVDPQSLIV